MRRTEARPREGWEGWDEYSPFYDWENAQTMGRRDVKFWTDLARQRGGPVLELGCGTGRLALPIARAGIPIVGIDRSAPMLLRARRRLRRTPRAPLRLVRGDIRLLPFSAAPAFTIVMAAYGLLQSLLREKDLAATLKAVAAITSPGALFGIDLVPDLPKWQEYKRERRLSGWRSGGKTHVSLIETVRQDHARGLTRFEQEYVERRGRQTRSRRFELAFRTITLPGMVRRIEKAGFGIHAVLGGYDGKPWDARADTWLILAERL
jgi:SAM-dependent methyltransferase